MRHQSNFKETQLFDWDTEPRLERSSSFFFVDEVTAAEERRARRRDLQQLRRRNVTLMACLCAIAFGAVLLLQLGPLLKHIAR